MLIKNWLNALAEKVASADVARWYAVVFPICYVIILIAGYSFPLYYETGNDIHARIVCSGTFSGVPEGLVSSYGCFVVLSDVYAWFYRHFPGAPWFDIFNVVFLSAMLTQCWLLLRPLIINRIPGFRLIAFALLIFLLQNIIQSEPTRTSMLLTATATVLLFKVKEAGFILRAWLYLMIVAGLLMRVESGLIGVVVAHFAVLLFTADWKRLMLQNMPVYLFLAFLLLFINWPRNNAEAQYLSIRPYQFTLWDYHPEHPGIRLKTKNDSIKYYTARRSFLADDERLTPAFFDRIGLKKTDKTPADIASYLQVGPAQIERLQRYFAIYIQERWGIVLFFLIGLSLVIYVSAQRRKVVLLASSVIAAICFMAVFMKMEMHLYYPLLCLGILLPTSLTRWQVEHHQEKVLKLGAYLAIGVLLLGLIPESMQFYKRKVAIDKDMRCLKEEIEMLPKESVVLLNLVPLSNWHMRFFKEKPLSPKSTKIPLDNGLLFVQKEHQNLLIKNFGCNQLSCYFKNILDASDLYMVSDQERLEMIVSYLFYVHGFKLEIVEMAKSTSNISTTTSREGINIFRLISSD